MTARTGGAGVLQRWPQGSKTNSTGCPGRCRQEMRSGIRAHSGQQGNGPGSGGHAGAAASGVTCGSRMEAP
ncbi:hypothetical protein [Streptomyces yangpuensis]|uniref:hypothetical protein n=1 Tax=Streptomyces yangpuensis TaxID=1648182 RepID=UPI0036868782